MAVKHIVKNKSRYEMPLVPEETCDGENSRKKFINLDLHSLK